MTTRSKKPTRRPTRKSLPEGRSRWAGWSDNRLLDLRVCDLDLSIEGTWLEKQIHRLYRELESRRIRLKPHVWLSDEWFSPDEVPGIAIPFYLAHPRLQRLEKSQVLEVEGGTEDWCMRILRHEAGHAIDHAYRLHHKKSWREAFGRPSVPYPDSYQPRPYSRSFVLHLDLWYAQAHPLEDFAETFAVWLTPNFDWRQRYRGWSALKKLECVDRLMAEIADIPPVVRSRQRVDAITSNRTTLREHYVAKRMRYGREWPNFYDRDLRRLFSDDPQYSGNALAANFLLRIRPDLRRLVARWTGTYQYTIDQVLVDMIDRCRELKLRVAIPEEQARLDAMMLVTVQTMNYLHEGQHRLAL